VNEEIHTLAGAYALDALDDLERMAFERHLRECEPCRTEAAEFRDTAARLADGTWSVPPPSLRENVMAAVAHTRQLAPHTPAAPVPSRSPRRLLAVAAAVVVAAGVAGTAVYAIQEQRVRDEHALAESARASEARTRAILAAPDLVIRDKPLNGGGRVTVAVSALHGAGVIMLAAGESPAEGHVYQLWTIRDGTPVSAGALGTGQTAIVQVVEDMAGASGVGVTVEPTGGSIAPTTKPVALVTMT
jgi:anti-sigma-K factor RskA